MIALKKDSFKTARLWMIQTDKRINNNSQSKGVYSLQIWYNHCILQAITSKKYIPSK